MPRMSLPTLKPVLESTPSDKEISFFKWLHSPFSCVPVKRGFKRWRAWQFPSLSWPNDTQPLPRPSWYDNSKTNQPPTPDIELGGVSTLDGGEETEPNPNGRRQRSVHFKDQDNEKRRFKDKYWFSNDPGFKACLRRDWKELLLLILLALPPLLIYLFASPLTTKYFRLDNPRYAYPMEKEYIPTWLSGVIALIFPFIFMGGISVADIGDYWDFNSAILGYQFALTSATLLQSVLKWVIGGLRPNFYHVCEPHPQFGGEGALGLYYTPQICMGERRAINNALMSFPSGHSAAAFSTFIFLSLWINAKFKVFANYKSGFELQLLFLMPITLALLLSMSKIVDYWHHWYDVLAGSLIGTLCAFVSYRQTYYAIWDYRFNHIYLPYRFQKEYTDTTILPVPRKDLTAINYAGWENKHTKKAKKEPVNNTKLPAQIDGVDDMEVVRPSTEIPNPLGLQLRPLGSSGQSPPAGGHTRAPSLIFCRPTSSKGNATLVV